MCDPRLAAEDARRYAEWRALLAGLVAPLIADEGQLDSEVEHLLALVDGLGLRIARETKKDAELARDQEAAFSILMRHLQQSGLA